MRSEWQWEVRSCTAFEALVKHIAFPLSITENLRREITLFELNLKGITLVWSIDVGSTVEMGMRSL